MAQTKLNNNCLEKAKDNEPIFVLRGQDKSSPKSYLLGWGRTLRTLLHRG
jgi:hypothetical protein